MKLKTKPKLVRFSSGMYGVRRFDCRTFNYEFLAKIEPYLEKGAWLESKRAVELNCYHTKEAATNLLNEYHRLNGPMDKGKVLK